MLKYTRWIASSAPIESSPPLRMWCTVSSMARDWSQHLPSRPGSHQHFVPSARRRGARGDRAPLDHVLVREHRTLAEVDDRVDRARVAAPGRWVWPTCRTCPGARARTSAIRASRTGMPDAEELGDAQVLVADRALDVLPLGVRRVASAGSAGRTRYGTSRRTCRSGTAARSSRRRGGAPASRVGLGSAESVFAKPSQLPRPPFSFSHRSRSKRGLGNLRKPRAPVEVPNARSHDDCRWSFACGAGSSGCGRGHRGNRTPDRDSRSLPTNLSSSSSPGHQSKP